MALIVCKECGKNVSDKAASCPACGCPVAEEVKKTEISGFKTGAKGVATGVLSLILAAVSIFLTFGSFFGIGGKGGVIAGIFFIAATVYCFLSAYDGFKGNIFAECPYCANVAMVKFRDKYLKCSTCKKISVNRGKYFETLPAGQAELGNYKFNFAISFFVPIVGFILGSILISNGKYGGKNCILLGVLSILIYFAVVWLII